MTKARRIPPAVDDGGVPNLPQPGPATQASPHLQTATGVAILSMAPIWTAEATSTYDALPPECRMPETRAPDTEMTCPTRSGPVCACGGVAGALPLPVLVAACLCGRAWAAGPGWGRSGTPPSSAAGIRLAFFTFESPIVAPGGLPGASAVNLTFDGTDRTFTAR